MITINDILSLDGPNQFRLVSGQNGLDKEFSNIGILDYESLDEIEKCFDSTDFVITSLATCKEDNSLLEKYLCKLIMSDVKGIAIKEVFFSDIPLSVKNLSNRKNVPIFVYDRNLNSEDIIVTIKNFIINNDDNILQNKIISKIINFKASTEEIRKISSKIFIGEHDKIIAIYMQPTDSARLNVDNLTNKFICNQTKGIDQSPLYYFKYKKGLFILQTTALSRSLSIESTLKLLPHNTLDGYTIGSDLTPREISNLPLSMANSISANYVCQLSNRKTLDYSDCGIYEQLLPIRVNSGLYEHYKKTVSILSEYDQIHNACMLETVVSYVEANGFITNAAAALKIHKNTFRYRLQKAIDLLAISPINESNIYEELFIDIKLHKIMEIMDKG